MVMSAKVRFIMSFLIILVSLAYAMLLAVDAELASAISLGYVAILASVFFISNVWKKHE